MEEMRPQAEKSIKTRLVLEAIVKAENIEVSDERVEEELTKNGGSIPDGKLKNSKSLWERTRRNRSKRILQFRKQSLCL